MPSRTMNPPPTAYAAGVRIAVLGRHRETERLHAMPEEALDPAIAMPKEARAPGGRRRWARGLEQSGPRTTQSDTKEPLAAFTDPEMKR